MSDTTPTTDDTADDTMQAVVGERYGSPSGLRVTSLPVPEPGRGQVRIAVRAAGVNPADVFIVAGTPWPVRLASGLTRPRQPVPGIDVAGVVDATGSGVTEFEVGDRVFGAGAGTFAESCVADVKGLARIPAGWSYSDAAAVPMAGTTALQLLRRALPEPSGRRLLVIGAGGGIGTFLVSLAAHAGAEVVASCSAAKHELVLGLGAAEAVDYAAEDVTTHASRYDAVIDNVAALRFRDLLPVLAPGGVLITNSGRGDIDGGPLGRPLRAALQRTFLRRPVRAVMCSTRASDLEHLAGLGAEGHLRPVVGSTHQLADAADALAEVAGGHAYGKVVVVVAES